MGQGYYRNADDSISDPELIAGRYKIGRSVFFEVSLVLAEYADATASSQGGSSSQTPTFIEAGGLEVPQGPGACPATDQYVWINDNQDPPRPRAVKASSLVGGKRNKKWKIYIPFGGMYHDFEAKLVADQPLMITETHFGARAKTSTSHKIIVDLSHLEGTFQINLAPNEPQMSCEMRKVDKKWQMDLHHDRMLSVTSAGRGDVVEIKILTDKVQEMLYACGEDEIKAILSHNRKNEEPN
jgi:hypothetical protein